MNKAQSGVVYLVGAGPGDPGLITCRGLGLLRSADVVLHDELVDPSLTAQARTDAQVTCVGKRGSSSCDKQAAQEHIEDLLVLHASAGRSVVRLKGGDPFLFGRGAEEALRLAHEGIAFEVVPGVSSALAAATHGGFSLTHRDLASSVVFLTARTREGRLFDFAELSNSKATLCIFMSLGAIELIVRDLQEVAGRDGSTPCAMISNATLPNQTIVEGTLRDIVEQVASKHSPTPAIFVVGDVLRLRSQIAWFESRPLFGKRILVARAEHQRSELVQLLREKGASPIAFSTIRIEDPPDKTPLFAAISALNSYYAIVFASENAVHYFFRALTASQKDARALGSALVCAVGPSTQSALEQHGIIADVLPARFVGEALLEELCRQLKAQTGSLQGRRVLVPRALAGRDLIPDELRRLQVEVDVVPVYQTVASQPSQNQALAEQFARGEVDIVLATSPSTAKNLVKIVGSTKVINRCVIASIGPVTTAALEELGLSVAVTAAESTAAGLVSAVEAYFSGREKQGSSSCDPPVSM